MRMYGMLLTLLLGAIVLSIAAADEAVRRPDDDPRTVAAIRELVRRGAVVKRFAVAESETAGLLVRLKAEHLDQAGTIDRDILATLCPLTELSLELRGLPFSDEGLRSLLAKVRPVGLDVSGSEISDCGLRELASARSKLQLLDLSFTRIGDDGLSALASLPDLRHLSLIGCRVTDNGVACLARLGRLREVYLSQTAVSSLAAERLRRWCPMCRIEK